MMALFGSVLLFAVAYLFFNYYRRLLAPAVLMPVVWGLVLLLHPLCQLTVLPDLYDLRWQTVMVFVVGALAFSMGGWVYSMLRERAAADSPVASPPVGAWQLSSLPVSRSLRWLLVLVVLGCLPAFIREAIRIFIASGAEDFLTGVRYELSYGEADLGPFKYLINFSVLVYGICQLESIRRPDFSNRLLTVLALAAAIVYAVFSTGRSYFVIILMLYLGLSSLLKPGFRMRKLWWTIPLLILVFTAYGFLYNKGGSFDASLGENVRSASENTAVYFVASLNAYDVETAAAGEPDFRPINSFRFFYVVAQSLGFIQLSAEDTNLLQEFVFVPYSTNVYTFYSPYTRDFGVIFAFLMLLLYGFLHSWLYHRACARRRSNELLYYALLLFPLCMSFFQDQYVSLLSIWLQSVIIIEGLLLLNKMLLVRRK